MGYGDFGEIEDSEGIQDVFRIAREFETWCNLRVECFTAPGRRVVRPWIPSRNDTHELRAAEDICTGYMHPATLKGEERERDARLKSTDERDYIKLSDCSPYGVLHLATTEDLFTLDPR